MLKLMKASKAWVKNDQRPLVYMSNSRTTRWQRKVSTKKAALQTPTLKTFLTMPLKKMSVNETPIELLEKSEIEDIDEIEEDEKEEKKDVLKVAIRDLQRDL